MHTRKHAHTYTSHIHTYVVYHRYKCSRHKFLVEKRAIGKNCLDAMSACCSNVVNLLFWRPGRSQEELEQKAKSRQIDKLLEKEKHLFKRQVCVSIETVCVCVCTYVHLCLRPRYTNTHTHTLMMVVIHFSYSNNQIFLIKSNYFTIVIQFKM